MTRLSLRVVLESPEDFYKRKGTLNALEMGTRQNVLGMVLYKKDSTALIVVMTIH